MLNKIKRKHVIILDYILLALYLGLAIAEYLGNTWAGGIASNFIFPMLTFVWGWLIATRREPSSVRY